MTGANQTPSRRRRRDRRVLLVGLTGLMMITLDGPLGEIAQVSAVPFPSEAFDRVAAEVRPHLVGVDVTYLNESRVRPLMMDRFAASNTVLVFVSESGGGWMDDLGSRCSGPIEAHDPQVLRALIAPPSLSVVTA